MTTLDTNTKSFGQFLHEKGMIDGEQLLEILEQKKAASTTLGEAAYDMGLLDRTGVHAIRNEQLKRDMDFGPAAVALGLLTEDQVTELEEQLGGKQLLLSRLILENGMIDPRELAHAELEYTERSMIRTLRLKLSMEAARNPKFAETTASVLQRLYERVMGSPLEMAIAGAALPAAGGNHVWSQVIRIGEESFTLAMQMAEKDALSIAEVVLGEEPDVFDDLAEDAVSEFLNIVMGHICGNLMATGEIRAEPPTVVPADQYGFTTEAVVLQCDGDDIAFHFVLP